MICSKIVNLDRTEAGLKSKLGKISPTIEWCYQNHDDIRRRATSPRNLLLRQAGDKYRQPLLWLMWMCQLEFVNIKTSFIMLLNHCDDFCKTFAHSLMIRNISYSSKVLLFKDLRIWYFPCRGFLDLAKKGRK